MHVPSDRVCYSGIYDGTATVTINFLLDIITIIIITTILIITTTIIIIVETVMILTVISI